MARNEKKISLKWRPRPHQVIPKTNAGILLAFGGRGSGKTWNGTRWLLTKALTYPNTTWGAVAQTWADALNILAEGEGGLKWHIEGDPEKGRPDLSAVLKGGSWEEAFVRSPGRMSLSFANGSKIQFASAEKPKSLRGKNWYGAIADEVAFWNRESFDMLVMAVRLDAPDGTPPQILGMTTPNGENWFGREYVLAAPRPDVAFVGGSGKNCELPPDPPPSTLSNPHTSDRWKENIISRYEGTDLARQEIYGEILSASGLVYKDLGASKTRAGLDEDGDNPYVWPTGPELADEVIAGQDLGTEHSSALIVLARRGDTWHAVAEVVKPAATEEDWWELIRPTIEYWQPTDIYSDTNFPQTIEAQRRRGLPIVDTYKGAGSVLDGIRVVQAHLAKGTLLVDTEACPVLWREMRTYRWATNRDGQPLTPERPVKVDDDAVDALRYSLYMRDESIHRPLLYAF